MRRGRVLVAVVAVLAGWLATPVAAAAPTPEPGAPGAVPDTRPGTAFADPKVAQLQVTATEVQNELAGLATQIHTAEADLGKATAAANAARRQREQADAVVQARQGEMDRYAAAVFGAMGQPNSSPTARGSTCARTSPRAQRARPTDQARATGRARCAPPRSRQ